MHRSSQSDALYGALRRGPVRVIAVTSGKGGVGKTNVAANVAIALAGMQRNVLLLDADLGLANVDVLLGLQPRFNLAHVIDGKVDLDSAILKGPNGLQVIPAGSGDQALIDLPIAAQASLIQAFEGLSVQPDILLVDTAAGISDNLARFVTAAQEVIVVVCDEPASITDAYALIKVLSRDYGVRRFDVVTNQTGDNWQGRLLFSKLQRVADQFLEVVLRHVGNVPHDEWLRRAVCEQRAVIDAYPMCNAARAFRDIAAQIDERPAAFGSRGGIEFFFDRLVAVGAPGGAG